MKAHVAYIGVVDGHGQTCGVTFKAGVNVITGRSSTGKSALIEIFDYCFGSSDFTVPVGVITEVAELYVVALVIDEAGVVLARKPNTKRAFLREEGDLKRLGNIGELSLEYFAEEYFSPLDDYLSLLRRYFGVVVTDVDVDQDARELRGQRKPRPSARSLTSFMFQHQNLVANKHAIFYRFDQKEKRDQAIEHLKVFLGFVDQSYYTKSQKLKGLLQHQKTLERGIPRVAEALRVAREELEVGFRAYRAVSGHGPPIDINDAVGRPELALVQLRNAVISVSPTSNEHAILRRDAQDLGRKLSGELRRKQQALLAVQSSIAQSQRYVEQGLAAVVPETVEVHASTCPFCGAESHAVESHANSLAEAIAWLNSELARSPYRLDSFEHEKTQLEVEIADLRSSVERCSAEIARIDGYTADIERVRTQYELTVREHVKLQEILTRIVTLRSPQADDDLDRTRSRVAALEHDLQSNYDVESMVRQAERKINSYMAEIGRDFDFEKAYTPPNLRFSLTTFDLWHEASDGSKVFLRSMGSGANWLSCHVVLFLALHRYFCERGSRCAIPSILFLDQPSQVYFPSVLDGAAEFNPEELAAKDSSRSSRRSIDEDVRAVANLFSQLVKYCDETRSRTGITPQIIVTDHADHMKLQGNVNFESLVRARWRTEGDGFISREMAGGPHDPLQ